MKTLFCNLLGILIRLAANCFHDQDVDQLENEISEYLRSGLQREKFVMMRLLQTSQNLSRLNKSWFTGTIFNLHAFAFLLRGFHPHNNKKSRLQCLNKEKKKSYFNGSYCL